MGPCPSHEGSNFDKSNRLEADLFMLQGRHEREARISAQVFPTVAPSDLHRVHSWGLGDFRSVGRCFCPLGAQTYLQLLHFRIVHSFSVYI